LVLKQSVRVLGDSFAARARGQHRPIPADPFRRSTVNPIFTPFMTELAAASSPFPDNLDALRVEVAGLIVEALNLDLEPASIDADDLLFGEGLGLDSIDILEVALVVSKRYGFQLRADNEDNVRIFRSLRSLTEHIAAQRTQ
jgi:acyl carrier protein